MKRLFAMLLLAVGCAASLSAQEVVRLGTCFDGKTIVISNPESSVEVEITVEKQTFTPGIYARYAQRLLGTRALLTAREESSIASASIALVESRATSVKECFDAPAEGIERVTLPAHRISAGAQGAEEQAAAAANRIFALRKARMDLIGGELGENVFGAGLQAALDEIARLEGECLALFYGTTSVSVQRERFLLTPDAATTNYLLCRYRGDAGLVEAGDLAGEMVMLTVEPSASVSVENLPLATEKSKSVANFLIVNPCKCTLSCGTRQIAEIELPLAQLGQHVEISLGK